jgi:hypothetical protein
MIMIISWKSIFHSFYAKVFFVFLWFKFHSVDLCSDYFIVHKPYAVVIERFGRVPTDRITIDRNADYRKYLTKSRWLAEIFNFSIKSEPRLSKTSRIFKIFIFIKNKLSSFKRLKLFSQIIRCVWDELEPKVYYYYKSLITCWKCFW